ncbi:hypothetical protein AT959_07005 [Dechloromonas denitrificans]|uniref:Uncharacterized protein n=1 Tax=Dechloromonas denitrificans TaxID=281362 RepID=A0A133XKE7_9RHOO|nr:tetratricopeptide repeat protein [Dechloromonas denitrificans]KXB31410.1 hypothetical protein AT959_07005 [Dechloromonas denitrificans]
MSLLMDALKRAETSKQEAARSLSGKDPATADTLGLEPLAPPAPRVQNSPLPDLAAHIDAVDAELASSAVRPGQAQPKPATSQQKSAQADREAVRNAFAAKQVDTSPSRQPLWIALGILGLAGLGIGGYVGYQVLNIGNNSLRPSANPTPAPASAAPRGAPAAPAVPVVLPPAGPSTAAIAPETSLFASPPPAPPPTRPARTLPTGEPESVPTETIRLTRSRPEVDSNQLRGYANIQRNELELARRDYEQALQRDPNNTDALLALAAIAQRQGRPGDAERLYQRALVANPSDPAVQAATLNGASAGADPQNTESRLKSLLAVQPESAQLNFALGNLYARQQRWAEAQQVYFNAVAADGDNPDYLFNLAISLDHIRQNKLAAQHYRLALEAADKRPAAFEREPVRKRLSELQP